MATARTNTADSANPQIRELAAQLREAATAAAETAGGGLALVFELSPEAGEPKLRAAAGFASPGDARTAATLTLEAISETLANGAAGRFGVASELGPRAAAGYSVYPLIHDQRSHGALLVAFPSAPDADCEQALAASAETLALQLARGLGAADEPEKDDSDSGDAESDEILRLSEALFAQDIELLRNNEKLAKIDRLKADFIERMSRELRTPLNSIIEAIISVLTNENDALSDAGKGSLRQALDDGTGFLRTLQNILDLWRLRQRELPVEVQDVNFRETVEEAIFSVQDDLSRKKLVIEQQIDESFPKIRTDLTKINQILFLLLDNAVKFTPSGRIVIKAWIRDERLNIEVRDTGIGIAPDDQQNVFEEFFQVDDASVGAYRGAGLGLALVRELTLLMEGDIALASEIGKGSTFSVTLPLHTG